MGQTCSYILVNPGDSCSSLAAKCGITPAQFTQYNPDPALCSTLIPRQPVCCSEGVLPDLRPQPNTDGTCFTYTVQSGDYCYKIAEDHYISVADIETYNSQTWGWTGCSGLQVGSKICLSSGAPPMPDPIQGAVCGPQVPGTPRPANWADLASLNPCPLNACCSKYGYCGITPDHCTPVNQNGPCISNCGTEIVKSTPPREFIKVGYWEAFNGDRPCLNMRADQIPSGYTHVHFAFAGIAPDLAVDFLGLEDEFRLFASQTRFKRILAFGGWSFSTNNDSVPIFRPSFSSASRLQFARNVANLVQEYNLDGVDFDWEFPADPAEGNTYLTFLASLRSLLPAGKTVSVATPASYYHLKNFPIAQMASVVDYVVFMTYDLHGQWDYGSSGSQDGCPNGDCLRSHVNLTETNWALSIITKAGVPSNKVVVGIASYGRSFRLADPNCISPLCRYTGPESQAEPGPCTRQRGIIAQAEIEAMTVTRRWYESTSDADYAVYGPNGNTWTSYLSDERKQSRINRYRSLNLGGSAEWAIDLAKFLPGDGLPSA